MRLVIIGGSDAGISAALRARELVPVSATTPLEITVVLADNFPNYSICGLPFFVSGEVADWHNLAHRTAQEIEGVGIALLADHTARQIDPRRKVVTVQANSTGQTHQLEYDQLVIATGAAPTRPAIEGVDLDGVFLLHTMDDSFKVYDYLAKHQPQPRSALIVGGGYIGLEMADALTQRGLKVRVVEHSAGVLKTVEPSIGEFVRAELERHNVLISTGVRVERIARSVQSPGLRVSGSPTFEEESDLVLVAAGVQPQTELALSAGVTLGQGRAIRVNRAMQTGVEAIYAAGDCVETWHRLLERPVYLPLGTTAHKQGRVAGENAVVGAGLIEGQRQEYAGSLGTQVVKIFELVIARTGLRHDEAEQAGFDPFTLDFTGWDHKIYYPQARPLTIRLTGDRTTRQLLGTQMVGAWGSEVSKRVDVLATALFHSMRVEELNQLDLSYTPPLSSPWDPIQQVAQQWSTQVRMAQRVETNS